MAHSATRRTVLAQVAACGMVAGVVASRRGAVAAAATVPHVVVVALRGALDGLAAIPPFGDRHYRAARGELALRPIDGTCRAVELDGFFGLHPALAPLHEFYGARQMIVLPAIATAYRDRLHQAGRSIFDWRSGMTETWLERAQLQLAQRHDGCDTVWQSFNTADACDEESVNLIVDLCRDAPALGRVLEPYGGGSQAARSLQAQAYRFRRSAIEAGEALAASDSSRLVLLETFGWDTHADQGAKDGRLANTLAALADGLVALADACGDAWRNTAVLVATEFGRSVGMNTMGGTDHGTASAAFLLGGAVAGGRIIGDWPGLAADRLYRGRDLAPTVNLHSIVKAALSEHLGLPRDVVEQRILPGSATLYAQPGLFRA